MQSILGIKKLKVIFFMILLLVSSIPILGFNQNASAASFIDPPIPYLSVDDSPFFGTAGPGASLCFIEDFEDSTLDFGITASAGSINPPLPLTDSVDADDGLIDGSGIAGHSWKETIATVGVTFAFSSPVTHAGVVWTDGEGTSLPLPDTTTTFEAFGPGMVSLGTVGPVVIGDMMFNGATAEDRFFGVIDAAGISAISIRSSSGSMEVDHVQFCMKPQKGHPVGGELVPLDTAALLVVGTYSAASWIIPIIVSAVGIGIVISRKF